MIDDCCMFGINPYRVKNIKLAKTDRNIIKELLKERQGIGLYLLARRLNKDVAHIYRRLSKMVNYGVISKIKSSVTIYSINDKQHSFN